MTAALPSYERWGDLTGKRVLVRVDFNEPVALMDGQLRVTDDFRIRAAVPLFEDLLSRGAAVVACTHVGRPRGRVDDEFSIVPIRRRLHELCEDVELLENLRFNPGEETNDPEFGASLVAGFDYFINEAFSVCHRAHASIMIPPTLVPSAAGPYLQQEVATLQELLTRPARPFVAIVGGAKVGDKLGIVKMLSQKADIVIVGGGMAYTFEKSQGRSIGSSLFDDRYVDECDQLMAQGNVLIPADSRGLSDGLAVGTSGGTAPAVEFGANIPDGYEGFDIGPLAVEAFQAVIASAGTILWNGPMGVFEDARFMAGTEAIAHAIVSSGAVTVVGGGDSVAALQMLGLEEKVTFVSTGGGACLQLVELGDLPGLRVLRESRDT